MTKSLMHCIQYIRCVAIVRFVTGSKAQIGNSDALYIIFKLQASPCF